MCAELQLSSRPPTSTTTLAPLFSLQGPWPLGGLGDGGPCSLVPRDSWLQTALASSRGGAKGSVWPGAHVLISPKNVDMNDFSLIPYVKERSWFSSVFLFLFAKACGLHVSEKSKNVISQITENYKKSHDGRFGSFRRQAAEEGSPCDLINSTLFIYSF